MTMSTPFSTATWKTSGANANGNSHVGIRLSISDPKPKRARIVLSRESRMKIIVRENPKPRCIVSSTMRKISLNARSDVSASVTSRIPAAMTRCASAPAPAWLSRASSLAASFTKGSTKGDTFVCPGSALSCVPPVQTRTAFRAGLPAVDRLRVVERSESSFRPWSMAAVRSLASSFMAAP